MKSSLLTSLLMLVFFMVYSQTDAIETTIGTVYIRPIVHGTVAFEVNDLTIYVDPYGGADKFQQLNDPDLVLITDIHGDHLNIETLEGLNLENTDFIVPQSVAEKLPDTYKQNTIVLNNGIETIWKEITIRAIPMYNLPEDENSRHTKGRGNGYLMTIGGKTIYLSGDTSDIPEMRQLTQIDVAFVCMNLPYTMSVDQAADAVIEFKPNIVYPYHYRGQGGLSDVDRFKSLVNQSATEVEVRLRNWYE